MPQGIYLDLDGTLATPAILGEHNAPAPAAGWALGDAGITLHAGTVTDLFRPGECVYLKRSAGRAAFSPELGVACSPALRFRRIMVNQHAPAAIGVVPLQVTDLAAPAAGAAQAFRTANVSFSKYNEQGYQFTVPVGEGRGFWLHWLLPQRVDPDALRLHKMDKMEAGDYVQVAVKEGEVRSTKAVCPAEPASLRFTLRSCLLCEQAVPCR